MNNNNEVIRQLALSAFNAGLHFAHCQNTNESYFRFKTWWNQSNKVNEYDNLKEENEALKIELKSWVEESFDNLKMAEEIKEQNRQLLSALKICWTSLQTYGLHPLIKVSVESAIKKAESK